MQIYTVFETLQSPFVGYHCKIKSLINYLIANLITFPGSRLCYAHCLKWADLRAPWADGRHGGLLRTSEKHFKGSGCAQTTLPPPMPFCQVRFLTWVFPGKCNPYVSDSLTLHLQREGPGSTIWLFRASFFLRRGGAGRTGYWEKGKSQNFSRIRKALQKSSVPWHPTLGGVMIGSGKSLSWVCCQLTQQFVRWLHCWGCQGQLETSSWLSGLEAVQLAFPWSGGLTDLPFWEEGGEIYVSLTPTRQAWRRKGWNGHTTDSIAPASGDDRKCGCPNQGVCGLGFNPTYPFSALIDNGKLTLELKEGFGMLVVTLSVTAPLQVPMEEWGS